MLLRSHSGELPPTWRTWRTRGKNRCENDQIGALTATMFQSSPDDWGRLDDCRQNAAGTRASPAYFDRPAKGKMNAIAPTLAIAATAAPTNAKVSLTPLGLDFHDRLTLDDWRDLGTQIGSGARSMAFVIGDWLVYAEGANGRGAFDNAASQNIPGWFYAEASRLTGMDIATLSNYAYVARNVPRSLRNDRLSWEHHRKIAKLKDDTEKVRWLRIAQKAGREGQPVSTRRLARSIEAGRLLSIKEMQADDSDQGIMNIHPFVNAICAFFGRLRANKWFEQATPEKRAALKRDLQPVVDLWAQL